MTKISSAGCARNDLIVEHDFNVRGKRNFMKFPINCSVSCCNAATNIRTSERVPHKMEMTEISNVGNAGHDLTVGHNFNVIGETTVIAIPINCNCNWCNDCQITLNCNTDGAETLLGIILAVRQYQDLGLVMKQLYNYDLFLKKIYTFESEVKLLLEELRKCYKNCNNLTVEFSEKFKEQLEKVQKLREELEELIDNSIFLSKTFKQVHQNVIQFLELRQNIDHSPPEEFEKRQKHFELFEVQFEEHVKHIYNHSEFFKQHVKDMKIVFVSLLLSAFLTLILCNLYLEIPISDVILNVSFVFLLILILCGLKHNLIIQTNFKRAVIIVMSSALIRFATVNLTVSSSPFGEMQNNNYIAAYDWLKDLCILLFVLYLSLSPFRFNQRIQS